MDRSIDQENLETDDLALRLATWPRLPLGWNKKSIFIAANVAPSILMNLEAKGWNVVDVRFMPTTSDGERVDSVKAWLEGVRLGTIVAEKGVNKFVELEAKALGMLSQKDRSFDNKVVVDVDSLEDLLRLNHKGVVDSSKLARTEDEDYT